MLQCSSPQHLLSTIDQCYQHPSFSTCNQIYISPKSCEKRSLRRSASNKRIGEEEGVTARQAQMTEKRRGNEGDRKTVSIGSGCIVDNRISLSSCRSLTDIKPFIRNSKSPHSAASKPQNLPQKLQSTSTSALAKSKVSIIDSLKPSRHEWQTSKVQYSTVSNSTKNELIQKQNKEADKSWENQKLSFHKQSLFEMDAKLVMSRIQGQSENYFEDQTSEVLYCHSTKYGHNRLTNLSIAN